MKKRNKLLVMAALLVSEAKEVDNEQLQKEIREGMEKITVPWIKEILILKVSTET